MLFDLVARTLLQFVNESRSVTDKGLGPALSTALAKSYFMLSDAERGVLNNADVRY